METWQTIILSLVGISVIIEFVPIKVNPWGWFLGEIGKRINKDMQKQVNEINTKLTNHIQTDEQNTMDRIRSSLLSFADGLHRGDRFSKERYDETLAKVDQYEKYCETHENYKNSKAVLAIAFIKENYNNHIFLQ